MSRVSILLPSYNHAEFLGPCLNSAISQTHEDWELIAVDDGSSDHSVQLIRDYPDHRIAAYTNEINLGTYGTLERALQKSDGHFIAVLNSDDVWAPKKLEQQIAALEAHPEAAFCYTLGGQIDARGEANKEEDLHANWPKAETQELLPFLLEENRILASSVLYRRSAVRFRKDLRYSGDWVALLDASLKGIAVCVPESLTYWRVHERNTSRRSPGQVAEEIRVRQSILAAHDAWHVRDVAESEISKGLSTCAMHLSALLVLEGRVQEARAAARLAARKSPTRASLRRLIAVSLPASMAHRALWHTEEALSPSAKSSLVEFGS